MRSCPYCNAIFEGDEGKWEKFEDHKIKIIKYPCGTMLYLEKMLGGSYTGEFKQGENCKKPTAKSEPAKSIS